MPTLQLSDEQVVDLVKQLPPDQQQVLYEYLRFERWPAWTALSRDAQDGARQAAAERGRDWDAMTEEEREDFIDDIVHEGR
jgi:hypothetical protein